MRTVIVFFLLFTFLADSCSNPTNPKELFDIQLENDGQQLKNGSQIGVTIKEKKKTAVKAVSYTLDGKTLEVTNGKITIASPTLGTKTLMANVSFDETSVSIEKKIRILAPKPPQVYTYTIINTYPHDQTAFTQGLEFKGDTLFESTGRPAKENSVLRKYNFKTGEVYEETKLDIAVFGEGLTLINDQVVQLTWRSGFGYLYKDTDLERTGSFNYGNSKEGWGLCNDGEVIYKSDGTEKIWLLDPKTLTEKGYIETVTNKSIFNKANELEYVDGKIYANVWQKESMMIIDPKSGAIEGVVNFSGLKEKVTKHPKLDVLNGVAYHPERQTFFVTGKHWDKLFEVAIVKR